MFHRQCLFHHAAIVEIRWSEERRYGIVGMYRGFRFLEGSSLSSSGSVCVFIRPSSLPDLEMRSQAVCPPQRMVTERLRGSSQTHERIPPRILYDGKPYGLIPVCPILGGWSRVSTARKNRRTASHPAFRTSDRWCTNNNNKVFRRKIE